MKVEYRNRFTDLLVFNTLHQFTLPALQTGVLIFALLGAANGWFDHGPLIGLLQGLACYVGAWLLQLAVNTGYLLARHHGTLFLPHSIEIQPHAFYSATRLHQAYYSWAGVVKVVWRGGLIAVYVSPYMAYLVPVRAFREPMQASEFFAQLKERIRSQP